MTSRSTYQVVGEAAAAAHPESADGVSSFTAQNSATAAADDEPRVVFSSPAVYHKLTWLLIAFAPSVVLIRMVAVHLNKSNTTQEDRAQAMQSLVVTLFAIVFVFVAVLPKRYSVMSDASIHITTLIPAVVHKFGNVTAAYEHPSLCQDVHRPRWKFATDFQHRLLIRRRQGGWDLLLTPQDVPGFSQAVWSVASQVEGEKD